MKVLVVDDSTTMIKIIKKTLKVIGYVNIVEAGNGIEGLAKMADGGIDLILSDWNMPRMNGLEFVKRVRKTDKKVLIIMITSEGTKDSIKDATKEGVDGYIVKPFSPETLKNKIKNLAVKN